MGGDGGRLKTDELCVSKGRFLTKRLRGTCREKVLCMFGASGNGENGDYGFRGPLEHINVALKW